MKYKNSHVSSCLSKIPDSYESFDLVLAEEAALSLAHGEAFTTEAVVSGVSNIR